MIPATILKIASQYNLRVESVPMWKLNDTREESVLVFSTYRNDHLNISISRMFYDSVVAGRDNAIEDLRNFIRLQKETYRL